MALVKVGRFGPANKIQYMFYKVALSGLFAFSVMMLIVINTIVLSLDRYPIDSDTSDTYNNINTVLTWMFFGEMIIKIIGMGPKMYCKDKFNLFDGFITLLTIAENIIDLSSMDSSITSGGAISGFRAIRLFRIFKLARQMKSFQKMLMKIAKSI